MPAVSRLLTLVLPVAAAACGGPAPSDPPPPPEPRATFADDLLEQRERLPAAIEAAQRERADGVDAAVDGDRGGDR